GGYDPIYLGSETECVPDYIWGRNGLAWPPNQLGSPQAMAVYLLNRGYASHALQRGLLLCEAMRVYDWKYLYPSVHNYDLRSKLIAHCTRDYPYDFKVQAAAGELSLADADYGLAVEKFANAVFQAQSHPGTLRPLCKTFGISEEHLRGRFACALTLTGEWVGAGQQAAL